ncbi:MAG: hypothetical protein MZV70_72000 [Desulfobacterales bacterium]|nr:hypothetical protein [Desulfobacterales bacterium]
MPRKIGSRRPTAPRPATWSAAAEAAGVKRIIYLGGLAEAKHGTLSKHLSSRIEVARILQAGRVPTTDLRTPMILGSGSASFEILRYLVERLPAMTTPRWVRSQNQPIAISNVIGYLVGCLEHPETTGRNLRHRRPGYHDLPAAARDLRRGSRPPQTGHHPGAGADAHAERATGSI